MFKKAADWLRIKVHVLGKEERKRNLRYSNLNETALGRINYETSSEEEDQIETGQEVITRDATTSTSQERANQTNVTELSPRKHTKPQTTESTPPGHNLTYQRQISSPEEEFDTSNLIESWRESHDVSTEAESEKQVELYSDGEYPKTQVLDTEEQQLIEKTKNWSLKISENSRVTFKDNKITRSNSVGNKNKPKIQTLSRYSSETKLDLLAIKNEALNTQRQSELLDNKIEVTVTPGTSEQLELSTELQLYIKQNYKSRLSSSYFNEPLLPINSHCSTPNILAKNFKTISKALNYKDWTVLTQNTPEPNVAFDRITTLDTENNKIIKDINNITDDLLSKFSNKQNPPRKNPVTTITPSSPIKNPTATNTLSSNTYNTTSKKSSNMATLSNDTYKILKRITNIASDDSKNEIRENIEKLWNLGKRIPEKEVNDFLVALAILFDCSIKEAIENKQQLKCYPDFRTRIIKLKLT